MHGSAAAGAGCYSLKLIIAITLICMAWIEPTHQLYWLALCAALLAFASATQDIAIDAYRIESAEKKEQGALAATYLTGYRLAMLVAGAGALAIAAWLGSNTEYNWTGWFWAYITMALFMLVGIITSILSPEPVYTDHSELSNVGLSKAQRFTQWVTTAFVQPFTDFFQRYGWHALLILALISCYRLSDVVLGVMANSFYVDMGFTKSEIAAISKVYGVIMTLVGAALGGILIMRQPTWLVLLYGAISTAVTNLLFILLSKSGPSTLLLTLVISADNLTAGIATTAFIAYLSGLTNIAYSATQYAVFSSVMLLFPKFVAGFSGVFVDNFGYDSFFMMTTLLGIPVLFLIFALRNYEEKQPQPDPNLRKLLFIKRSKNMIWTILGFGALGGVIACQLQHAGQHVRVILPRKFQSQATSMVNFHGYQSESPLRLAIEFHSPAQPIQEGALIVATKGYDSISALETWKPYIASHIPIFLLNNGMGVDEQARILLPNNHIITGVTELGAMHREHCSFRITGEGPTWLGISDNTETESATKAIHHFKSAIPHSHWTHFIQSRQWQN